VTVVTGSPSPLSLEGRSSFSQRDTRCREIFLIQATSLARRLLALPEEQRRIVIGVSGGQDSTHALLVATHAVDLLSLPRTRVFGAVRGTLHVRVIRIEDRYRIGWDRSLTFPGLAEGERLSRVARPPHRRGAILSSDREVLARGPADAREYPEGSAFAIITGHCDPPQPGAEAGERRAQGWNPATPFGQSGLEASLDDVLGGFVTQDAARAEYGVAIDGDTIDPDLTRTLRTKRPPVKDFYRHGYVDSLSL